MLVPAQPPHREISAALESNIVTDEINLLKQPLPPDDLSLGEVRLELTVLGVRQIAGARGRL